MDFKKCGLRGDDDMSLLVPNFRCCCRASKIGVSGDKLVVDVQDMMVVESSSSGGGGCGLWRCAAVMEAFFVVE